VSGVCVLLVEGERHTREAVQLILERSRAEVTAVATASSALEALRAAGGGRKFDVLVSDVALPEQDGYELMRAVRGWEDATRSTRPIPALALTAFSGHAAKRNAKAAGFQMHLAKPVEPTDLIATLARLTGRSGHLSQ
jgi:CheY-like chemotaxis protein